MCSCVNSRGKSPKSSLIKPLRPVILASVVLLSAAPAVAGPITSTITDSISLTTQGAAVQTNRVGSSYAVSGTNIKVDTTDSGHLGGLTAPASATAAATLDGGSYDINTAGQAFTFSESFTSGDAIVTSSTVSNGVVAAPVSYGSVTTQAAGSATGMSGALSATGIPTVTAGGVGTTAVGQRTIELSVFH